MLKNTFFCIKKSNSHIELAFVHSANMLLMISFAGLTAPVGDCDQGYYCPLGVAVSSPTEYPCPIGLHCPTGSDRPQPCLPGTFTNLTLQYECIECPDKFYCVPEEVSLLWCNSCVSIFKFDVEAFRKILRCCLLPS